MRKQASFNWNWYYVVTTHTKQEVVTITVRIFLAVAFVLFLIVLLYEILRVKDYKKYNSIYNTIKKHSFAFYVVLLLLLSVCVYWNFITLNRLYVYTDIASDSYYQIFPMLAHLSDYIRTNGFPLWSFSSGLGQNLYSSSYTEPFTLVTILFGKNLLPFVMGYMQVLKVMLAGILFYCYMRTMSVSKYTSMAAGICYAFCGNIIARGAWFTYATEVATAAFLLLSFELYFKKRKWYFMPLGIMFTLFTQKGYYLILYSLLIFAYAVFRYISEYSFRPLAFLRFALKTCGLYILGFGMSAAVSLPSFYYVLNSPRVSGSYSNISSLVHTSIFALNSADLYAASYLRSLSSDIMGTGSEYVGVLNYLEAPLFYCGLLTLLMLPQIFKHFDVKSKILHGILLALTALYIVSAYFRIALNGFSGEFYKCSSFWIIIIWLFIMAKSLDMFLNGENKGAKLLYFTAAALIIPLLYFIWKRRALINLHVALPVVILLVVLCAGLAAYVHMPERRITIKAGILALVVFEALLFSSNSVNNRIMLLPTYISQKLGYYDDTNSAVSYLNSYDKGFYRAEKTYNSVFLCDSLFQDYAGTKSYQSFNSSGTLNFYTQMGINLTDPNNMPGFGPDAALNTFVSVKYFLSHTDNVNVYGYKKIASSDGLNIFENQYYLPLGTAVDKYIYKSDFDKLSVEDRELTLLNTAVLYDGTAAPSGLKRVNSYRRLAPEPAAATENYPLNKSGVSYLYASPASKPEQNSLSFTTTSSGAKIILPVNITSSKCTVSFELDSGAVTAGNIYYGSANASDKSENGTNFAVNPGVNNISLDLGCISAGSLSINPGIGGGSYTIKNLVIRTTPADAYYYDYRENVQSQQGKTLNITKHTQNMISGTFTSDKDTFMTFTIPYDTGWKAVVDGKPVKITETNIGFIGVPVSKGSHNIKLSFFPPMLAPSIAISAVSVAVFTLLIAFWLYRRKKAGGYNKH